MVTFIKGNIFDGFCDVICHQVNCQGVMGSGIAREARARFPVVYKHYANSCCNKQNVLGNIDVIDVCNGHRFVVNMYSQKDYLPRGVKHTDYEAFRNCIKKIKEHFYDIRTQITIGFPYKIGCGLGGGDWNVVLSIIEDEFKGNEWDIGIWKL